MDRDKQQGVVVKEVEVEKIVEVVKMVEVEKIVEVIMEDM
jgi:hypothetical protein